MAAFEAEVEAISLLSRLLRRGVLHRIQLRTGTKHIEHPLFAAMPIFEIEGCE